MAGPPLDGATVLIRDGRIDARDGRIDAVSAGLTVPPGARVIDAAGGVDTPGFMDSATQLGVVEIGSYDGTTDQAVSNDRITAAFSVADGYNPLSTLIPVTRVEGITRAVGSPAARGSLIAGQGIVVHLGEGDVAMRIVRSPASNPKPEAQGPNPAIPAGKSGRAALRKAANRRILADPETPARWSSPAPSPQSARKRLTRAHTRAGAGYQSRRRKGG